MCPNTKLPSSKIPYQDVTSGVKTSARKPNPFTYLPSGDCLDIVWGNVAVFTIGHLCYFYAMYLLLSGQVMLLTYIFCFWMTNWAGVGIGTGAHRLWAHKSFKAKTFFRGFLAIGQLIAGQNCLYIWCRDHRVHHKYSDSDGDPHNSKRGFFFAHVGWLLRKKHPEVKRRGAGIDLSDLLEDPIVRLQTEHYWLLYFIFALALPVMIPVYCWGETWKISLFISYFKRYLTSLHCTWFVNSAAHMFGGKPFNSKIEPAENIWVSFGSFGEGYHNYHHSFPYDYMASDLPYFWNINKVFIDTFAYFGQASNLKRPSQALINALRDKTMKENDHHMTKIDKDDFADCSDNEDNDLDLNHNDVITKSL